MILLTMAPWLFNQMVNHNIIRSLDDHFQKVDFFDAVDLNKYFEVLEEIKPTISKNATMANRTS